MSSNLLLFVIVTSHDIFFHSLRQKRSLRLMPNSMLNVVHCGTSAAPSCARCRISGPKWFACICISRLYASEFFYHLKFIDKYSWLCSSSDDLPDIFNHLLCFHIDVMLCLAIIIFFLNLLIILIHGFLAGIVTPIPNVVYRRGSRDSEVTGWHQSGVSKCRGPQELQHHLCLCSSMHGRWCCEKYVYDLTDVFRCFVVFPTLRL